MLRLAEPSLPNQGRTGEEVRLVLGGVDRLGRLLRSRGDLMGVQIVEIQLIDQRLLDFLMQQQEPVGVDLAALVLRATSVRRILDQQQIVLSGDLAQAALAVDIVAVLGAVAVLGGFVHGVGHLRPFHFPQLV